MNLGVPFTTTSNLGGTSGGVLHSVGICAGADAATVIIRQNGSGGEIICKIGCAANTSVQRTFRGGVVYSGQLHGTVSGTTPQCDVEIG